MAANQYNGELDITLYDKVYPMKINMNVIAKFQSETDQDYMRVSIRAMNALRKTTNLDPFDQAQLMTEAVSMHDAAWLFFLAAKELGKTVTFESYPIKFANLVIFATLGVIDNAKKQ